MSITIPESARFVTLATFHDGVCKFFRLRNAPDLRTRRLARQSVRHFISSIRQLS